MDSKKARKMFIIAGVAVLLVGSWILNRGFGRIQGVESVPEGKKVWVKCDNRTCGASYEMALKEYYKKVDEKVAFSGVPPIDCEKCGKASVFRAINCKSCGEVSRTGADRDRCPKCGANKKDSPQ